LIFLSIELRLIYIGYFPNIIILYYLINNIYFFIFKEAKMNLYIANDFIFSTQGVF